MTLDAHAPCRRPDQETPLRSITPSAPLPRLAARPDVQGLRGVAVLLVALAHAGVPGLAGGYIGVDVFLVLSGYLISSLLLHEATTTGTISLAGFYARRARRILPAATLTLTITALVATLTLPYVRADQIVRDVVWSTFFAANLHFAALGTDYFTADLPPSPVQHYWSLAVEEQFYLVWPPLLVLVLAIGLRWRRSGAERAHPTSGADARRRLPLLTLVVLALCAASLGLAATRTQADPTGAYFSTLGRVWELGAGVLLALAGRAPTRLPFAARAALGWAGLLAILLAAVRFDAGTAVPGLPALLPVAGTVALLAAGAAGATAGACRLLASRWLGQLGDLSYAFYLWHWPFLVLPAEWSRRELGLPAALGLLALALGASWLSFRVLEDPVRRMRSLGARPRIGLALWPSAVTVVLVTVLWSGSHIGTAAALDRQPDLADATTGSVTASAATDRRAVADAVQQARAGAPIPGVVQDLRTLTQDKQAPDECTADDDEDSLAELCPIGDLEADRTIVLLGDSHARMWRSALERYSREQGWRLVPLLKVGCPAVDWPVWRGNEQDIDEDCTRFHDWAMEQIAAIAPDVVVVGSHPVGYLADEQATGPVPPAATLDAWQTGMQRLVDKVSGSTGAVRLVLDVPQRDVLPATCLSDSAATMRTCTTRFTARIRNFNARTEAVADANPDTLAVDLTPFLCFRGWCPMVVSGIAVYADDDHLSKTYADHLYNVFGHRLRLPGP